MHGNNTINFTLKAAPVVKGRSSISLATTAVLDTEVVPQRALPPFPHSLAALANL